MKKQYKLSNYNHFFKVYEENYIFNTFTCAIAQLDQQAYEYLEKFDELPSEQSDYLQLSIDNGFIVKSDYDEKAVIDFYRSNTICQNEDAVYEILTTTACNARCFYCFEEGYKPKSMSSETAEQVCKFICEHSKSSKRILIQWFGGEPLINPDVITYITKKLDQELTPKGIKITYRMTTNGSLINDEIVELFKTTWHISKVQITLDGTKNEYESRKKYINVDDNFEKVIKNINTLSENGIRISIRLNYDKNNISNILELIDYLGKTMENKENIVCYGYPLFGIDGLGSPEDKENALLLLKINKKIIENDLSKGKNPFNIHFVTTKCYACMRSGFLITPDGKLAKCSMALKDENDLIGDIYSPIRLSTKYLKWCTTELTSKECEKCLYLPLCQGGCKAGNLGYSNVRHYIYKNCFDEMLKEYVSYLQR